MSQPRDSTQMMPHPPPGVSPQSWPPNSGPASPGPAPYSAPPPGHPGAPPWAPQQPYPGNYRRSASPVPVIAGALSIVITFLSAIPLGLSMVALGYALQWVAPSPDPYGP